MEKLIYFDFKMRKLKILIVTLVIVVVMIGCEKNNDAIIIPLLKQSWTESHEENPSQNIRIYRPSDYKEFPVTRYRQLFIFQDNNKCDYLKLAANDAHFMILGTWAYEEENKILTIFNKESEVAHKYEMMELRKNVLKLRRK